MFGTPNQLEVGITCHFGTSQPPVKPKGNVHISGIILMI